MFGMLKGEFDFRCALVFALVHCVLEICMFCSLRVLYLR